MTATRYVFCFACLLLTGIAQARTDFYGLGKLNGAPTRAIAMSPDGGTVIGTAGSTAFIWDFGRCVRAIPDLPAGAVPRAISDDANVIVGTVGPEAFKWTRVTGGSGSFEILPRAGNVAIPTGVSRDGSFISGTEFGGLGTLNGVPVLSAGVRWINGARETWPQPCFCSPQFAGWIEDYGFAVTSFGALVAGHGCAPNIPVVTSGDASCNGSYLNNDFLTGGFVTAAARDGSTFLSSTQFGVYLISAPGPAGVPLGFSTQIITLPDPRQLRASSGGQVVTCIQGSIPGGYSGPIVWTAGTGPVPAALFLANQGLGAKMAGWTITEVADVSPDGTYLIGTGINPLGSQEVWVADLGTDSDGDGLRDDWEISGIPMTDGSRYQLPSADWQKPNLYVEIDLAAGASFDPGAIFFVKSAFASRNVVLTCSEPEAMGVGDVLLVPPSGLSDSFYTNVYEPNFGSTGESAAQRKAKARAYRYCAAFNWLIPEDPNDPSNKLGRSDGIHSRAFVLGLGDLPGLLAGITPQFSLRDLQAAAFMHELGHTLGLLHGGFEACGGDAVQAKLNYVSVMNYAFALPRPFSKRFWTLDYSSIDTSNTLAGGQPLNEAALDENLGIQVAERWRYSGVWAPYGATLPGSNPPTRGMYLAPLAGIPVDWNRSGSATELVQQDLNQYPACASPGQCANVPTTQCSTPGQVHFGHNDWANLKLSMPPIPTSCRSDAPCYVSDEFVCNLSASAMQWMGENVPTPPSTDYVIDSPSVLNTNAATDVGEDVAPVTASNGAGTLVTVWRTQDSLGGTIGTDGDVLFARSENNGRTWSAPTPLNSNAFGDTALDNVPKIAHAGGQIWICVWNSNDSLGGTIGTDNDILYSRSLDDGRTWSVASALNENASTDDPTDDVAPRVASNGTGRLIVVWMSRFDLGGEGHTDYDVFCKRSDDFGQTWHPSQVLNSTYLLAGKDNFLPTIVHAGNQTWVAAWSGSATAIENFPQNRVLVARSIDGGASWSPVASIEDPLLPRDGNDTNASVSLATDGAGHLVAAWQTLNSYGGLIGSDLDAVTATSDDAGATWSAATPLNYWAADDGTRQDDLPVVSCDRAGIWVATWSSEYRPNDIATAERDVWLCRSDDNGRTWTRAQYLNTNALTDSGDDRFPAAIPLGSDQWLAVWRSTDTLGGVVGTDNDLFMARFPPSPPCLGDLNDDNAVNTADLVVFLGAFGAVVPPGTSGDLNSDGVINTADLVAFLGRFGQSCP